MANKDTAPLQSYLQLRVPLLVKDSKWHQCLKASLGGVRGVNWHSEGRFHITAAFIQDMLNPIGLDQITTILREELQGFSSVDVTFDTIVAFTGTGGDKHYVCLSATELAPALTDIIGKIRAKLTAHGYCLGPFRFHVTLAEIPVGSIELEGLRSRIGGVSVPSFTLALKRIEYRTYERPSRLIWP